MIPKKWRMAAMVAVAALLPAAVVLTVVGLGVVSPPAHAGSVSPVYVCSAFPCTNSQTLETFDHNGAPIFSVPEYGGPAVYGDNFRVFAPGADIRNTAQVTFSGMTPAAYNAYNNHANTCNTAGARWIEPGGDWVCESGLWVKVTTIP